MPPKDMQTFEPLMFSTDGGKTLKPLGKLTETNVFTDDLVPDAKTDLPYIKTDEEMSFSCKFSMDRSAMIFLATGKWPSNNWLKMHGIPMRRRYGNRRR